MASYVESLSKLDWVKAFQRTGAFPIDRTDLFASYEDAVKYAAANASDPDSRELYGTSYIGQVIAVYENDEVNLYQIDPERKLVEVGRAVVGDGKSIDTATNDDNEIVISILGIDKASEGQQIRVNSNGELEFFTPSTDVTDNLAESKADKATTLAGYGIEDAYTKDEIDGKLTGAYHYKGTYDTFSALVADVEAGTVTPTTGDVYNITNAGGTDANGTAIKTGDNVVYNGTGWDSQSGTTDLSSYYLKTEVDTKVEDLSKAIEDAASDASTANEELETALKVEKSTTNGNIKVGGTELNVYTHPETTPGSEIDGAVDYAKSLELEDGTQISADDILASTKDGVVKEAAKVSHTITIGTKTFDGTTNVTIEDSDVPIPKNIITNTDYGTADVGGVVKSSSAQDKVSVDDTGIMTVNNISASKVQGSVESAKKVDNAVTVKNVEGTTTKTFDGSTPVEITAEDLGALVPDDISTFVQNTKVASTTDLGLVKSSTEQDKVSVDASTGVMTVNNISSSKVQGSVSAADKLNEEVTISTSGDATGSVKFDGSKDAEIALTLADSGVTASTYTKVTVDSKGRVTKGETLTKTDIPTIDNTQVSGLGDLALKSEVARTDIAEAFEKNIADLETASHTHDNKSVIDGITSAQVTKWDSTSADISGKADKATTLAGYGIEDAYTKEEVDGKVASSFHYKGTSESITALTSSVTTPEVGDVYNIANAGGSDANGTAIKAGDNVAWNGEGWDVLAGTTDLSSYYTKTQVDTALSTESEKLQGNIDGATDRLDTLESTVGDDDSGLVKDVADLKTKTSGNATDIASINSTIGADDTAGLRKRIADNEAAITTLNGDATTEGSVKKLIASSASDLTEKIEAITEETTGTIDTRIEAHNTSDDAHADLFDAKQNKIITATIEIAASDFTVDSTATTSYVYKCAKTISAIDSTKDYIPEVTPLKESEEVIGAAIFAAQVDLENGVLSLYATKQPTDAINLFVKFTEI